jgi:hypothetical protein
LNPKSRERRRLLEVNVGLAANVFLSESRQGTPRCSLLPTITVTTSSRPWRWLSVSFFVRKGFPCLDALAGALVALTILRTGIEISRKPSAVLMDT